MGALAGCGKKTESNNTGFEMVCVRPVPGYLTRAEDEVITPKGKIYVRWTKKEDGTLDLSVRAPEGMRIIQ